MYRKIYALFTLLMLLVASGASAQEIRYVSKSGQYSNDGRSWSNAKANIQDAINDLVDNGLTGEVWVAAGTYTPTESTESTGGSTLYMSFKIPAGISVYGGFEGNETSKDQRAKNDTRSIGSVYKNSTILSGDLSSSAEFVWNSTKEQWNTSFYGNCYHVVFFATKGFDSTGRAKPNGGGYKSALLEGCIIEHGNAYNSDITGRPHNAYGGGVYMVEGSHLQNCLVRQCVAYRDGGGIYMDGGGYVEHCGVTDCQTLGIGTTYGYGGGVCMDGPDTYGSTSNPMILRRSGIFGCVARMGGGISIAVKDTLGNNKYQIACTSVVVANNTAATEAGGVYMNRGGAITQMTIVNNKCNGAGVITNGMTNGRAAGIYCRDNAIIANSVMWGGVCKANNNIQFATSRSGNSTSLNPQMFYSSLTHSDYTDWSGVTKKEVAKLSEYNTHDQGTANVSEGYPMFHNPTPNAGYVSSAQAHQFLYGGTSTIADGVTLYDASGNKVNVADIKLGTTYYTDADRKTVAVEGTHYTYLGDAYDFQPESRSSINHKGIITADLDRYGQTPAFEVDLDVMGRHFTPRPTNGAYTSATTTIEPQQTTGTDGNKVYNFYVDPQDNSGTEYGSIGSSWNQPVRFLADALNYITDQNYPATATVNVYVKQGMVNNTTTSVVGRIRTTTINIPSNVHLYGGYSSENTGTSLTVRNPNVYVTTISAEAQGIYDLNVAHLLIFNGTQNTMLDGFSIRRANARSTEMIEGTPVTTGAAMTFTNASEVVIRNCGVANNTASQGSVAELVSSEVHFENCIFHNNESRALNADGSVNSNMGNILVDNGSKAVFSHCNFIRNVGYAIDTYGKVIAVNSMFYGNMSEPLEDTRNNEDKALVAVRIMTSGSAKGTFEGNHNLYDRKSADFITANSLDATTNEAILTYTFNETSTTYPRFINPTKNAGVSTSGDVTYYGRTISFQPHNSNPMVNRASTVDYQGNATDDHTQWGTDMTGIITRDYGGLPDIGAVENHESSVADEGEKAYPDGQRAYGKILYVRDYNTYTYNADGTVSATTATDTNTKHADGTARDGSSWANAINGNATYTLTTGTTTKNLNGLQYAAEMAGQLMSVAYKDSTSTVSEKYRDWANSIDAYKSVTHTYHNFTPTADNPQREVWVGAGIYTKTDGFSVVNHVKVYGGFPKTGTPGKNERHPQLTTGVSLSTDNMKYKVQDYETILQTNSSASSTTYQVSVLSQPTECRVTDGNSSDVPQNRVRYTGAEWDGFTIRYGYKPGSGGRCGGAGLMLYENVTVSNCVIRENRLYGSTAGRGAGIYVDGSIITNCYIINNQGLCTGEMYGGGMYMIKGTIYNSVIANNTLSGGQYMRGSGAFFESAYFFNNTVVNNTGGDGALGVWTASAADAHLTVYNSIIMCNTMNLCYNKGTDIKFKNCFIQSTQSKPSSNYTADETNKTFYGSSSTAATCNPFAKSYANAVSDFDFRIEQKDVYNAVNAGTQFIDLDNDGESDVTIPSSDMDYADRVQDCEIDMGAFEYNGAYSIEPDLTTESGKAIFYVTPEGRGNASATNPTNAACASKLQKVLDAAGRYKYNSPTMSVIVKVANSNALHKAGNPFQYYACRTADEGDEDVRVWSIIVPRGVEVWGGYTDTYTDADNNGFYTKDTSAGTVTDNRDITGNPTYFNSYYYNKSEQQNAYTYHVVTFSDRVFDGDGKPYKFGDTVGGTSSWTDGDEDYMSMKTKTADRAVIDGIFVTGGNADAQVTSLANTNVNINQYGGAAIVTDFAHVRNCIVRGNKATYGGALALTHNALVSGCLIDQNTADYGGAIYMFENGTKLSDGTVINTASSGTQLDENMAHVYTSTIVNNIANNQGGGIWFGQDEQNINIRVNSTVVWQNSSAAQANVSGLFNPTKATGNTSTTMEFYPFAYCAVQNLRLSGVNNVQLGNLNSSGARFAASTNAADDHNTLAKENTTVTDFSRFAGFGYYALTNYSVMVRTGMPVNEYTSLVQNQGLAATDFTKVDRLISASKNRSYIEMGARALDKMVSDGQLMLRLFVAKPEDINMDAAQTMMSLAQTATSGSAEEYYSQEGSSFAYPMQNLQDALDYIVKKRSFNADRTGLNHEGANNLPFEIFIAQGTYYPTHNLAGVYGNSPGNSFVIPEGVSVFGSFSVGNPDDATSFFGRYYKENNDPTNYTASLAKNVTALTDSVVTIAGTYKIEQKSIESVRNRRRHNDNNGNDIIEPWEFEYQTILSGDVENSAHNGVYHVVTLVADQNVVGMLPKPSDVHNTTSDIYHSISYDDYTAHYGAGSFDYEEGQYVVINGVQITGGRAMDYIEGSTTKEAKYNYYYGGGLLAEGNRYCDAYNKYPNYYRYTSAADYNDAYGTSLTEEEFSALETAQYMHKDVVSSVGYRDIPLTIARSKFIDNAAGVGGALYSNGTVNLYMSAFEQNRAQSGEDNITGLDGTSSVKVAYSGIGGAVMATHQFSAYNTLFANNEAYDKNLQSEPQLFPNVKTQTTKVLGGAGGVLYVGPYGYFHLVNCDLVRNQANVYPAVFTLNPNRDFTDGHNGGVMLSNTYRPSTVYYNQLVNTVVWGNDINDEMSGLYDSNPLFKFNARLLCNYAPGEFDTYANPDFTNGANVPKDQAALDANSNAENSDFGETAWFCAYEDGRGITPLNDADLRKNEYSPFAYARDIVHTAGQGQTPKVDTYQNCNILLSSTNFDLEGPNFINPSLTAGYNGYDESADWSPARINNLVDNGSGEISQSISLNTESGLYEATFNKYKDAPSRSASKGGYTSEQAGDYDTEGAYTTTRVLYGYDNNRKYMPVGDTEYMKSSATGQQLYRISYDPNPTHNQTYIDIGVYEYPHTQLSYTTTGDEVDILWVSPIEKPDNGLPDGSDWTQPTSDLQRAIETLLASRNGHRKEIRLMNGSFTPIYSINDKLAFCIDTKTLNSSVVLPVKSYNADGTVNEFDTGKGVVSLTIKGGYSRELNNVYNPDEYPAVIRQQARTNESSDRWDYLFYVIDGTQRYGYEEKVGYNANNHDGNYAPDGDASYKKEINTIPIHIDGVTLVNNQALKGVNGAAIHYADLNDTIQSPTAAHVSVNTYYTDAENRDEASKSPGNTPTLYYERAIDKYYTDATFQTVSDVETPYATFKYEEKADNKLIISKSKVMNSGSYVSGDYTTCAVYIGKNGGSALLYNDVMHSNLGNPLVSAVNTTIVNNTYALNKGRVDLNGENTRVSSIDLDQVDSDDNVSGDDMLSPHRAPRRGAAVSAGLKSAIFNSVFWRNNDNGTQFVLPGFVSAQKSGAIFSHNALTGFKTDVTDYSLNDIPNENYNVGLSDVNNDVINGPNFTDPKVDATSQTDVEARNFTLQPSLRLLNKGSNALYNDKVTDANCNIYDLAWLTTTRMDAGGVARFCYDIDLGAYEYQNNLNRIIYVNPNVNVSGLGNSWADPVAYGNLQAAIDLASVYHVNNTGEEAYVFVKGAGSSNVGLHLGESITMRNGVSVYGSILPTRTEDCPYTDSDINGSTVRTYTEDDIRAYVATLTAERAGVASPSGNRTTVSGISVPSKTNFDDTNSAIVSLVDGFDVTAANSANPTGAVTAPVIDIQPANEGGRVAVRNLIVRDNDASATPLVNIANVNNALIYEALFRDNKVSSTGCQLHVMPKGYGVNLTVEGTTVGADGKTTYNGSGNADHIYNSLVNYAGQAATENTLSGYSYKVADPNLNYQLTEQSKHIDQCAAANPIASVTNLAPFIDYATDRDLLGNLRLLSGVTSANKIDRGAFETWRVDQNAVQCTSKDADGNPTGFYPHQGSVVYVMKGNSLVMEPYATTTADGVTTQTAGTSLRPAYLLVQEGASLYGSGNAVNVGYLGLERTVSGKGAMVSVPYAMRYLGTDAATNGVGSPSYDTDGVLLLPAASAEAYSYNGVGRSAWNSSFSAANSDYWTALSADATEANRGVLYKPEAERTYRFTSQGHADNMDVFVYNEVAGGIAKTVDLIQYDDRQSTDGAADFTDKDDMGWNCIGLPWLVSNYGTADEEELSGESHRNMDVPHTLWLWYDGVTYPDGTTAANGDGGFYSVSSWDVSDWHLPATATASIWAGEGIFTQTAAVADKEELTFYRPVYAATAPANGKTFTAADGTETVRYNARYYLGQPVDEAHEGILITVRGHIVTVSGLQGGERIVLYDAAGRINNMATAPSRTYTMAVPTPGAYVVQVDGLTRKVLVR